jgi:hypothetical protein
LANVVVFLVVGIHAMLSDMRKKIQDTRVLPYIQKALPDATEEEKLALSFQFRAIFNAWWAIAMRVAQEELEREKRDKAGGFDSVRGESK